MSTFLSMTLTANGRALRVLFVDAAARRTVLAKLLYDGFLSVRKFPSDCRCALAQKQPGPKIPFPACFCASRLPTWMQSSARIFRSTPYLAYLFIMAAQLWRGQSRIRCGPLLHNLVNGWRRAAVIRGFLWLKFFYKLFVCLALRQLLHPPKNGHEKSRMILFFFSNSYVSF